LSASAPAAHALVSSGWGCAGISASSGPRAVRLAPGALPLAHCD
jgi:hypothetical protein